MTHIGVLADRLWSGIAGAPEGFDQDFFSITHRKLVDGAIFKEIL